MQNDLDTELTGIDKRIDQSCSQKDLEGMRTDVLAAFRESLRKNSKLYCLLAK